MPKVTASSRASKKTQVPTGGKNKHVTTPPFVPKHCDLWEMLQSEHYEHQHYMLQNCPIPTERDEASYHVLIQLFKAMYPLEDDDIHGHQYYFDKIVLKYITKHGMMPERWSHVYAHGISEEEFQQSVDLKVKRMRSSRRFSELRSKQVENEIAKVAKEKGISEYDAWLSAVTDTKSFQERWHEKVTKKRRGGD